MSNVKAFIDAVVSLVNLFLDTLIAIAIALVGIAWFVAIGIVICVLVYVVARMVRYAIGYFRGRNNKSYLSEKPNL